MMEPLGTNIFFLADRPQRLAGGFQQLSMDTGGAVYDLDTEHPINRYEAESLLVTTDVEELRLASNLRAGGLSPYLTLPKLDARIPKLAETIAAAAPSNYEKAVAIERYLATHFGYHSKCLARTSGRPPHQLYLQGRRGTASAFQFDGRHAAVAGHSIANRNRLSGSSSMTSRVNILVRASDAHSVETKPLGLRFDQLRSHPCGKPAESDGMVYACSYMSMQRHHSGGNGLSIQRSPSAHAGERRRPSAAGASFDESRHWIGQRHRAMLRMAGVPTSRSLLSRFVG